MISVERVDIRDWNGAAVEQDANRKLQQLVMDIAHDLEAALVQAISTTAPPASTPGECPHRRSGLLADSFLVARLDETDVFVGNLAPHAEDLELGTSKMEPRPYFRPTLATFRDRFDKIEMT